MGEVHFQRLSVVSHASSRNANLLDSEGLEHKGVLTLVPVEGVSMYTPKNDPPRDLSLEEGLVWNPVGPFRHTNSGKQYTSNRVFRGMHMQRVFYPERMEEQWMP